MTDLEKSIKTIADVYHTYASEGGKKRQLDKEELRKLFQEQIKNPEIKVRDSKNLHDMHVFIKNTLFCFSLTIQMYCHATF